MKQIVDALRRCRKETDLYRIQIAAENYLTPAEVFELAEQSARIPNMAREWLEKLTGMLLGEIEHVRSYARLKLGGNVLFYGHAVGEARRPHLLLAYCGGAHRLMVPIPVALQYFDDRMFDVVVLADPAKVAYAAGIDGYADSFDGVLHRLDEQLDFGAYETVRSLGTSIGGLAALRAGVALKAERAVSIGGRAIRQYPAVLEAVPNAIREYETTFAGSAELATRIICAFGADHLEDRDGAAAFAETLACSLVAVPGIESHNLLFELLKKRQLERFMDSVLLGDGAFLADPTDSEANATDP